MPTSAFRSDCTISSALDLFGDKWTLLIIRDMVFHGKTCYGDFLQSKEKIATNILVDRLQLLESEGFVKRKVSPANKSKFLYSLTEKGQALLPVLMELVLWGARYCKGTSTEPPELLGQLKRNKSATLRAYHAKLKKQARES